MPGFNRTHFDDLRGATRLAFDASTGITRLVGAVHGAIERTAVPFPSAANGDARGLAGLIYRGIGGGMRVLGTGIDAGLAPLGALLPAGEPSEVTRCLGSGTERRVRRSPGSHRQSARNRDEPASPGMRRRSAQPWPWHRSRSGTSHAARACCCCCTACA